MSSYSGSSHFLSCDWGSSFLRLRLADRAGRQVIAEERSATGIRESYRLWKEGAGADPMAGVDPMMGNDSTKAGDPGKRIAFYLDILRASIREMEEGLHDSLAGLPLVLSGMASSSAGMLELPYARLPFALEGRELITKYREADAGFPHPLLLISGIRSEEDVMRGEETQLIGCRRPPGAGVAEREGGGGAEELAGDGPGDGLYIFPGTHSKHILVKDRKIVDFTTYMTGEFFGLLA